MSGPTRIRFLGHATVVIEIGGRRFITDPVLANRFMHLRRHSAPVSVVPRPLDAVLISHLHQDHLDLASLRRLSAAPVVVPRGGGGLVARAGRDDVREVEVGDTVDISGVRIEAVPAVHPGGRRPFGPESEALGFVIEKGGRRIYFAGDTDIYDEMRDLRPLDVALLPVWGWGTSIGEGHLDPSRAADALRLLEPRVAIPIHWGTFLPVGTRPRHHHLLHDPPVQFESAAGETAPDVEVRILEPGEETELG